MNPPDNIELPFFAYGLFKPGQLAFYKIQNLIGSYSQTNIFGYLKERDGVPIFVESDNSLLKGFLIKFKDECEAEGYAKITSLEPKKYYKWIESVTTDNITCNVLLGKNPNKGTSDFENGIWDGKKDPYFNEALIEIRSILEDEKNNRPIGPSNFEAFFRLQMAYLLLWISIERYASLRYNLSETPFKKIMHIADDEIFPILLEKYYSKDKYPNRKTVIFKSNNPNDVYKLDPLNAKKSLKYYYQVRSNSVHMGKTIFYDYETIKAALKELLEIFTDILNYSFEVEF